MFLHWIDGWTLLDGCIAGALFGIVMGLIWTVEGIARKVGRMAEQVDDIEEYVAELHDVADLHRDDAE